MVTEITPPSYDNHHPPIVWHLLTSFVSSMFNCGLFQLILTSWILGTRELTGLSWKYITLVESNTSFLKALLKMISAGGYNILSPFPEIRKKRQKKMINFRLWYSSAWNCRSSHIWGPAEYWKKSLLRLQFFMFILPRCRIYVTLLGGSSQGKLT